MYLSIIILPLLSSVVSGFFGRKVGVTGSRILSCLSIITTTILAIISFFEVGFNNNPVSINLFKWLDSESFNILWNFQFDSLTVSMLIPVLVISSLVHFYSIGYMSHDPHNQRFFSYLSLFTFMMIILVTGNNYLLMFVGWEGVGVCSYLLVSFWFTRIAANQSSLSAFLTNRVGDAFLTIGMFAVLWSLGNLDYSIVFSLAPYINEDIITIIGICLLIGAMAKSSQVGLHIWLPMAMEGPTPVSALIHAATMVTAGVYLLIRSSPLIEYSSTVLLICLWLGAITTVFSSLIGLFQQDIKKIIAYSTMSQLGMMVIAIGLSSYNIAIFHLMNHAFYKGLLFLGAGAVIHAVADNQDLRKYGGLRVFLPLTYTVILIASLSLVALPFMTGFYSKDFILESAYGQYHFSSINVYVIAVIGAIFTTLYSVKVLYLTFLTNPNGPVNYYKNAHEGDIFLSLPLVILALFSIYFGFITKDIYIGLGSGFFVDNSIFIHPLHEILIDTEFGVPTIFKLIPFFLTLLFTGLGLIYSEFIPSIISSFKLSNLGYYIFGFFNQRFLIEFFYNKFIVNKILLLGGQTTKILDKGSIEWIGPYGNSVALTKISKIISSLSKGVVTDYALYILISVCFYLLIFTFLSVFFDIANSMTASCIFILVLIGSSNFYKNINSDNENLVSSMGFLFKSIKNGYLSIKFYSLFVLSFKVNWIFNLSILFLLVNFLIRNTDVSAYLNSFQSSIFSLFDFNMRDVFYAMCNQNTLALQGVGTLDNASAIEGNVHITILQVTGDQNSSSQEFNYQKYKAEIDVNNLKLAMDHTEKMVESIKSNPSLSENDKEIQIRRWIEDMAKDTTEMAKATKTLMDIDNSGENIASPSNKRAISDVGSDEIMGKRKA
jgi:NADH-ubiquinone oxidoreductase chain 5